MCFLSLAIPPCRGAVLSERSVNTCVDWTPKITTMWNPQFVISRCVLFSKRARRTREGGDAFQPLQKRCSLAGASCLVEKETPQEASRALPRREGSFPLSTQPHINTHTHTHTHARMRPERKTIASHTPKPTNLRRARSKRCFELS